MSILDNYGLRDPFDPRALMASRPRQVPKLEQPTLPQPQKDTRSYQIDPADTTGGWGNTIAKLAAEMKRPVEIKDGLADIDRRLRAEYGRDPRAIQEGPDAPPRRIQSPLEGPDDGSVNWNASYGDLPPNYFGRLRGPESGGNPSAANPTTGAGGLYQFLQSTWDGIMRDAPQLGLTPDGRTGRTKEAVAQQEAAIRHYTQESMRRLVPFLGRNPTAAELYALHHFGHQGGMTFLRNQDAPAGQVLPASFFEANPWLRRFYGRPAREVLAQLGQMIG